VNDTSTGDRDSVAGLLLAEHAAVHRVIVGHFTADTHFDHLPDTTQIGGTVG